MKRRMMNICGETFEVVKNGKEPVFTIWDHATLNHAYDRPSQTKVDIWNYWLGWARQLSKIADDVNIWIASRNCFMFTLTGYFVLNGIEYGFYITKTRQEIWQCE